MASVVAFAAACPACVARHDLRGASGAAAAGLRRRAGGAWPQRRGEDVAAAPPSPSPDPTQLGGGGPCSLRRRARARARARPPAPLLPTWRASSVVLHPLRRLGYFFVAAPVTAICGGLLDGPWARPRSTVTAASAARSVVPRQSSSCQGRALEEGKGGEHHGGRRRWPRRGPRRRRRGLAAAAHSPPPLVGCGGGGAAGAASSRRAATATPSVGPAQTSRIGVARFVAETIA